MPLVEPGPKGTIHVIDQLVKRGLIDDAKFRGMHHFGGGMQAFLNYCASINSFQSNGENRKLHDKLQALLDSSPCEK